MKRHEKSVLILVLIVVVFLASHSFRLGLQSYQVPIFDLDKSTKYCAIEDIQIWAKRWACVAKQQPDRARQKLLAP